MGGGASKGIPASGVSREQLLKSTQPMRTLMDAALQLMLSELAPADLMALGDSGKCSEYAVATGDAFESYFKSIRVEPLIDKRNPKQGVIFFQDLDAFKGQGLSEAQKIEKKQLCTTLGFFYTRVFQIYAALALTLFDDANIRPSAVGIGRRYDILPYGTRAQAGPGFGRGPGVAVMRGGAFVPVRGGVLSETEDKPILGEVIFNLFKNYIYEKDVDTRRYRIKYPDGNYARQYILSLTVPEQSRGGNPIGILTLDSALKNKRLVEVFFEIKIRDEPAAGSKIYGLEFISITLETQNGVIDFNIRTPAHKPLFTNFKFDYSRGTGVSESIITSTCGGRPLGKPLGLQTTLYRSLIMLYLYQGLILEKISNDEDLPSNIYPCRMDIDLSTAKKPVVAGPTDAEKELERLKKEKEELERKYKERLDRGRDSRYDDYATSEIRRRAGETDREYIYRLKAYVDTKARRIGWDSNKTTKQIGEDIDDYMRRLERYARELRDLRGDDRGYGSRGTLQRKAGESEYDYQKRVREHYREYYKESDESKAAARIGDVYATLKKGTRPIAHCVARALQLVSFDPSARGGRSYVCNYKFLEPTPNGIPQPGHSISESVGLKSLSTLFAAFSKGRILYQDPGRTEYLNFLRGMSEAFGDDPRRVSDSWLPAEGEKSSKPLEKIVNKADGAKCVRQDVIELGGKAYVNAVAASRILMARQVKHARDVEQIFRELFIVGKGVIKIHPQILALGLPGLDAIATKTRRVLAQYYRECEATYQDAASAIKNAVRVSTKGGDGDSQ